jgi:hypothetical protein
MFAMSLVLARKEDQSHLLDFLLIKDLVVVLVCIDNLFVDHIIKLGDIDCEALSNKMFFETICAVLDIET